MALIIKLSQFSPATGHYWQVSDTKTSGPIAFNTLSDLPAAGETETVAVIIPGDHILCAETDMPKLGQSEMRKALPFALEEQLSESVDQLYFALGSYVNGKQRAFVISISLWQQLLDTLKEHHIKADIILPDYLALRWQPQQITLCHDQHLTNIRYGMEEGVSLDFQSALHTLAYIADKDYNALTTYGPVAAHQLPQQLQFTAASQHALDAIDLSATLKPAVNLLQAKFRPRIKQTRSHRYWRWFAAAAGAWFVVWIATHVTQYYLLSARYQNVQSAIFNTYNEIFPGSTQVVEPRFTVERELHKYIHGSQANPAVTQLKAVGMALRNAPQITIQQVSFDQGTLTLTLNLTTSSDADLALNNFKQYGLSIKNQSTNNNQMTVEFGAN